MGGDVVPMPRSLPNHSQKPRNHQNIEEALQNNSDILQIIPINIHTGDTTYNPTSRRKQHPIPLPSPPNNPEPLVLAQVLLPMFLQVDKREHDCDSKDG